jgi:hypothetical protein
MTMPGLPLSDEQSSLALFARYRDHQYMIGHRVEAAIAGIWARMIDPARFNESWHRTEPVIMGVVDTHYGMSAADAAEYYTLSRAVAGFFGRAVPNVQLRPDYLSTVVNAMAAGQFFHFLGTGDEAPVASGKAMDALQGAGVRLVMNGGRDTVTTAASFDYNAQGWERIMESDKRACDYCSMLAGSSGVHKSFGDRFHAHDRCYCLARTVFNGQQSYNADIQGEWKSATAGKSGKAAVAAWKQYWSDGNVGPEGTSTTEPAPEEAGNAPVVGQSE